MVRDKNKLKYEDLKVGMRVSTSQLSDLYGVWIYINPETKNEKEVDILYFCTEETRDDKKIEEIANKYGKTTVIYQPEFYAEEDAEVYDD